MSKLIEDFIKIENPDKQDLNIDFVYAEIDDISQLYYEVSFSFKNIKGGRGKTRESMTRYITLLQLLEFIYKRTNG